MAVSAGIVAGAAASRHREATQLATDNRFSYFAIMIRTQVSLREDEYAAAKAEAARLGISLAELLRQSLHRILPPTHQAPWMRFAGSLQSGDPRSSERIDEVVYGEKP
jgi:hypothetical protein